MAKAGINNEIKTKVDLTGEKSTRFEKLLGLFSEKDQNFLINAPEAGFSAFLEKGGFPAEELLDARQSWASQGGVVQSQAQQNQEETKQEKEQHQGHAQQRPHTPEEEKEPPTTDEASAQPKERLWGPKTNYSEPARRPTINRPIISRGSFSQRMPNFGIQRRSIGGLNRGARVGKAVSATGRRVAGKAAQAGTKLAARGAVALLSNPIGWIIIAAVGIILLLVFIVLFFFTGSPAETGPAGDCDGVSASSLNTTRSEPTTLTAINCTDIQGTLVYRWTSDSGGTFSNPTGISTTYAPSSDTATDITITVTICSQTDPSNCFSDSVTLNAAPPTSVNNARFYCQYASTWNTSSRCQISNYGCTQSSIGMAMSTYRTDTYYNPLKVARDNGGVMGCTRGTFVNEFTNILVPYMRDAGYVVAASVARGRTFDIDAAEKYIKNGYVLVAGGAVWYRSKNQKVPGGHAFLIVGADASKNTLTVYDPTYCGWMDGDKLIAPRTMTTEVPSCSFTAYDRNGNPIASNCPGGPGVNTTGSKYVFAITNFSSGWWYARPVKLK